MDFWDPYERARRRRLLEQRRRAEQEAVQRAEQERLRRAQMEQRAQPQQPPTNNNVLQRFEQELAQARRERDEWADRYKQLVETLSAQQQLIKEQQAQMDETREQQQAKLDAEAEEFRTQLRAEADSQRERLLRNAEQRAFGENRETLARLLDVADNFDRVLKQESTSPTALVQGVELTYRDFRRALERAGVTRLESVGQPFDPNQHEAIAQLPRPDTTSGTIIEEVAPGYTYKGNLLRPAKVVVAE